MSAPERRQGALTIVCVAILGLTALRALPRPLDPPVDGKACRSPVHSPSGPMTAPHLRCDGDGPVVRGSLLLLAGHRIQLNTANPRELADLPGIGDKTARRIVDHRTEHGPFPSVESLSEVRGIGRKTVEKLRPFVAAE